MTVETRQWLFQDRQVMTRWGRVVHASVVQTGTAEMLTLCGRSVARDAQPGWPGRRCVICFPSVGADDPSLTRSR